MIKKAILGTAALFLLGAFVFGRDVFQYARTSASTVREAIKAEVPVEFQVDTARRMVEDLVPEIRQHMHVIAEQQVDVEHLNSEIVRKEKELGAQKQSMLALKGDLDGGGSKFVYASRTYTSDEVKQDLARRFDRYKAAEEALKRDRTLLTNREKSLRASEEQLDKMLATKQDLEVQITQLDARLKTLRAAETVSTVVIDDSQLARAKKLIARLNKDLDVQEKLLDADGKFTGLIPVESRQIVPENITSEIDSYFEAAPEQGQPANAPTAEIARPEA